MTSLDASWSRAEYKLEGPPPEDPPPLWWLPLGDNLMRVSWWPVGLAIFANVAMRNGEPLAYVWVSEVQRSELPRNAAVFPKWSLGRSSVEAEADRAAAKAKAALVRDHGVPKRWAERMVARVRSGWRP